MTSSAATVGISVLCVLNFAIFSPKKKRLGGNQARFKYKKYKRYKSLIAFTNFLYTLLALNSGRSGGAIVLGKLPVPGRPTIWMIVGQGPIALAVVFRHSSAFVTGNWTRNGRRQF